MSVIGNPLLLSPEGYQIERSVRLRSSASAYFNRTPASAGNRKTWTWSGWVKRGTLGTGQGLFDAARTYTDSLAFRNTDTLTIYFDNAVNGDVTTTQVFRDVSAWYHIVVALDTTQATASNRVKIYVNGSQVTSFSTASYPSQNLDCGWNNTVAHNIGRKTSAGDYLDGYLTDINFIDGQALTPSSFGETDAVTGVWKPKKYAGTYGTNGFYLNFSDPSGATATTIGKDSSGNGNNWTPNNISVTAGETYDSMIDVPTPYADGGNGRGNYCTLNPIFVGRADGGGAAYGTKDGNLKGGNIGSGGWAIVGSTIVIASGSGKYYFECVVGASGQNMSVGVQKANTPFAAPYIVGYTGDANGYSYDNSSLKWNNGSAAYGSSAAAGDVIGIAVDASSSTASLEFYKNGVSMGVAFTGITGDLMPALSSTANGGMCNINFGQRPFAYTPPTGFKALNTGNLPEPTIVDGSQYFDATTYTGNGTTQSIVNSGGMQPDLVWVKVRSAAYDNRLFDSSRPLNAWLSSNLTSAEINNTLNDNFLSYNSNGFSVGPTSATNGLNQSGQTFVGWQWKANGAGVSNTDGSITSTVSAGVTQGFSVVTYTGTGSAGTIGHGLGVAPAMVIVKNRSGGGTNYEWFVYHKNMASSPQNGYLLLNSTAAYSTAGGSVIWNSTAPTSSVFSVGTASNTNINTNNYVAYCFAEVPGFSKFGSYTGNGSADGPFVFCGFRPRFVLIKLTSSAGYNWVIIDTSRSPVNTTDDWLFPNLSSAEVTQSDLYVDVLSNGFKHRQTNANVNASGATYIYAAFAESPFKTSLAR